MLPALIGSRLRNDLNTLSEPEQQRIAIPKFKRLVLCCMDSYGEESRKGFQNIRDLQYSIIFAIFAPLKSEKFRKNSHNFGVKR